MAIGRSDVTLKLEIIKKINITVAIVVGVRFGIMGLVLAEVISSYVNLLVNMYFTRKFLKYNFVEQIKDVAPTFIYSAVAGLTIYFLSGQIASAFLQVSTGFALGFGIYLGLHYLTKTQEYLLIQKNVISKLPGMLGRKK